MLAEKVLRTVQPQALDTIDPGLYVKAPPLRFTLRPGFQGRISNLVEFDTEVGVNAWGMRDDEIPTKAPDEERLLILGDSFVFGWGVEAEETFTEQLERELSSSHPSLRVLNGGVPGYGLTDVADWLEYRGAKLEPDVVLVGVFLGNDLLDVTAKHRQIDVTVDAVANGSLASRARHALYRRSHLVRLIKRAMPPVLANKLRAWAGLPEPWNRVYLRDMLETHAVELGDLTREGHDASRLAMDRLTALAERYDFRLLIALLPGPLKADDDLWEQAMQDLGAKSTEYERDLPARFFRQLAESVDLPVTDLTPTFRSAVAQRDGEAFFFRFDPHWTIAGHRLAAEALRDFVVDQGLKARQRIQVSELRCAASPRARVAAKIGGKLRSWASFEARLACCSTSIKDVPSPARSSSSARCLSSSRGESSRPGLWPRASS